MKPREVARACTAKPAWPGGSWPPFGLDTLTLGQGITLILILMGVRGVLMLMTKQGAFWRLNNAAGEAA